MLLSEPPLTLEVNTGAATSLVNEETCRTLWRDPPFMDPARETLRSYLGKKIPPLGSGDQTDDVQVLIVQGKRAEFFGNDWYLEGSR